MAILGSMGLSREHLPIDLMPRLWSMVVRRLLDTEKEVLHEVRMLSTLLLHGTYEAVTAGPSAEPMRAAVEEALRLTFDITDEWHRRRRARAWVPAGRAALGSGDRPLARAIAGAIALSYRVDQPSPGSRPWRITPGEDHDFLGAFFSAAQPMPRPKVSDVHTQPEVIAAFQELLDQPKRRRAPRKRPAPISPPLPRNQDGLDDDEDELEK